MAKKKQKRADQKKLVLTLSILGFAAFIVFASALYQHLAGRYQEKEPPRQEAARAAAPDFTVYTDGGGAVSLSDYRGEPVVVNFWASWCPPCKAEMPHFEKAYRQYGDRVRFLMVDLIGGRETKEQALAYLSENGFTFPVFFDNDGQGASAYRITGIPLTVFVDGEGRVAKKYNRSLEESVIFSEIKALLGEE